MTKEKKNEFDSLYKYNQITGIFKTLGDVLGANVFKPDYKIPIRLCVTYFIGIGTFYLLIHTITFMPIGMDLMQCICVMPVPVQVNC